MRLAAAAFALTVAGSAALAAPADEPLRPEPKPLPPVVKVEERVPVKSQPLGQSPEDCTPVAPNEGPPPKPYKELKLEEGEATALEARKILFESEKNIPPEDVAGKIEGAVARFFDALALDPYNVIATYNLSAAYARIGRNQCALNLLARLVAMKNFHSRKASIDQRKDALFGTGKRKSKGPDPDFSALRGRPEFDNLVKNF
jgi:tetratricopeptide (TPR) repeat protein